MCDDCYDHGAGPGMDYQRKEGVPLQSRIPPARPVTDDDGQEGDRRLPVPEVVAEAAGENLLGKEGTCFCGGKKGHRGRHIGSYLKKGRLTEIADRDQEQENHTVDRALIAAPSKPNSLAEQLRDKRREFQENIEALDRVIELLEHP